MKTEWEEGFKIFVHTRNNHEATISANKKGLLSLACQRRSLAEGKQGDHIHYDEYQSLEEGSLEMIIERVESIPGCWCDSQRT